MSADQYAEHRKTKEKRFALADKLRFEASASALDFTHFADLP